MLVVMDFWMGFLMFDLVCVNAGRRYAAWFHGLFVASWMIPFAVSFVLFVFEVTSNRSIHVLTFLQPFGLLAGFTLGVVCWKNSKPLYVINSYRRTARLVSPFVDPSFIVLFALFPVSFGCWSIIFATHYQPVATRPWLQAHFVGIGVVSSLAIIPGTLWWRICKREADKYTYPVLSKWQDRINGPLDAFFHKADEISAGDVTSKDMLLAIFQIDENVGRQLLVHLSVTEIDKSTAVNFNQDHDTLDNIIRCSCDEARLLGHDHLGTEHLVLGILRVYASWGESYLNKQGVDLEKARPVLKELASGE